MLRPRPMATLTTLHVLRRLAVAAALLGAAAASAAPIRYATIAWDRVLATPGAVSFTVQTGWRLADFGSPGVGSSVDLGLAFDFGDGHSQAMVGTTQAVSASGGWFTATSTFTHTYDLKTGTVFDAGFSGCCTLPDLQNANAGQTFDITSRVNLGDRVPLRGPRTSVLPELFLALGQGMQTIDVPVTAFGNEFGRAVLDVLGGAPQPDFISERPFGPLQVDTSAPGLRSGLYDLRLRLESFSGFTPQVSSTSSAYLLLNLVCTTGPSCSNPGLEPPQGLPEPGSAALAVLALAALGAGRRR